MKICSACGQIKLLSEFHRRGSGHNSRCKECRKIEVRAKMVYRQAKLLALKMELGGLCIKCGDKDPQNLEFHHKDPDDKIFSLGQQDRSYEVMYDEAMKCDLLCSHCHRQEERKHFDKDFQIDVYTRALDIVVNHRKVLDQDT